MRSSSSSRSFSPCSSMSCRIPRDIRLKDSASSPSWSRERTRIWWSKSPCLSFCVPTESAWTPRVIERARRRPSTSATPYITVNTSPRIPIA